MKLTTIYDIVEPKQKPISRSDLKLHLLKKYHIIHNNYEKSVQGIDEGIEDFFEFFQANKAIIKRTYFTPKKKPIAYFITLTSHPDATEEDFKKAYTRIQNYKQFSIDKIYGVIEYTKRDLPHLHIYTQGSAYIRLPRLKRIWKLSNIDVRRAFNFKGIEEYLQKDSKRIVL